MATVDPPQYGEHDQLANRPPPLDPGAVWQQPAKDQHIQRPVYLSQDVAGLWKDRWGDMPQYFYQSRPALLDIIQRIEVICQRLIRQLTMRARDRLIICSSKSPNSSVRTSFSESKTVTDSDRDGPRNRLSAGSSISSMSEGVPTPEESLQTGRKTTTIRVSKFKEGVATVRRSTDGGSLDRSGAFSYLPNPQVNGAEVDLERIVRKVNEWSLDLQAYGITDMSPARKHFASLQFQLSKKQQAASLASSDLFSPSSNSTTSPSKGKNSIPPSLSSVAALTELANSIDPNEDTSAENAQLVLKRLAGIAQECASKLKDCSTALNLAVSQCKSSAAAAATSSNNALTTIASNKKAGKGLDPIAEQAITNQIAQAKQTVDMLSDALWAEGTDVGMERLEREAEKAVKELDERIERASRGLANLGSSVALSTLTNGPTSGRKPKSRRKRKH